MATVSPSLMRALEAKRRWLAALSENGHDCVALMDETGTLTFVTSSARIWGVEPAQLVGRRIHDLSPADERSQIDSMLARVAALPPGVVDYERCRRISHADGAELWLDVARTNHLADPDVRAIVSYFHDVTAIVHAEQARAREERMHRTLLEALPDPVVVHDFDGRILWVNPAAVACIGRTDLIGATVLELVHPADRESVVAQMRNGKVMPEGTPQENRGLRPDGEVWIGEWRAIPCNWEGRGATFAIGRDVTRRKRLETQLAISDRMASVGQLAAGVAHEINNPLAALMANLSVMERELRDSLAAYGLGRHDEAFGFAREIEEPLRDARESAQRVRDIVRDLKVFSRAEDPVRRTAIDVRRTIESALRMAQNEVKHRARVVTSFQTVPPVEGNESRLGQVFLNLIVNAAQAIADGHASANEIRLATRLDGDHVIAEVTDSGHGMTAEVLKRIFDPFFTTKPAGEGTGLGLSISHQIVASMGGEIQVESAPGKGSTFRLVLPAAPDAEEATPARPYVIPPPTPARPGRVLVIDDELPLAKAIARTLSRQHEVTIATSGREGLALLEAAGAEGAPRFDVVLCDLMMPEVGGIEVAEAVARRDPPLAASIIFLTGGAFTASARTFLERAPNLRLDKPVDEDALRALVAERVR